MSLKDLDALIQRTAAAVYYANKGRYDERETSAILDVVRLMEAADSHDADDRFVAAALSAARAHDPDVVRTAAGAFWHQSKRLQSEFSSETIFAAFVVGVVAGRGRMIRGIVRRSAADRRDDGE